MELHLPCIYCGHPAEAWDHIIPRCADGSDDPANLAPACKSCNSAKGQRDVSYFLRENPEILARVKAHQAGQDVLSSLLPAQKPRATDRRITTSVHMSVERLQSLKIIAAKERVRLNDLLLEAIEHVLARHAPSAW